MEYITLNNGVKMPILWYGTDQTPPRMKENFASSEFDLEVDEMLEIEQLEIVKSLFG